MRAYIDTALEHGLGNGRVESIDAKIFLIQRRAFGPLALSALAKDTPYGFRPAVLGRP